MDGKEELICCSIDGEVRGYLPPSMEGGHVSASDSSVQSQMMEDMYKKKQVSIYNTALKISLLLFCDNYFFFAFAQELLLQLKNFEINEKVPI